VTSVEAQFYVNRVFTFSLVFVGFGGMLPIFLCIVYMSDFVSCDNIGYHSISIGHLP